MDRISVLILPLCHQCYTIILKSVSLLFRCPIESPAAQISISKSAKTNIVNQNTIDKNVVQTVYCFISLSHKL